MGKVLGASFGYHDSAVALVDERQVIFAQHEERVSRVKFDPSFPRGALGQLRAEFGTLEDLAAIVVHEKPVVKMERQVFQLMHGGIRQVGAFPQHVTSMRKHFQWTRGALRRQFSRALDLDLDGIPILYSEHHLSHAAATFLTSPHEEAIVLVVDAVGEWDCTTVWHGSGNRLSKVWSQSFPHSIGMLYSALTQYLGFKVNTGEYKLMGLAPYGRPRYLDQIKNIVRFRDEGTIELDLSFFDFVAGRTMISPKLERLLGRPARSSNEVLDQWHADVASSTQALLEQIIEHLLTAVRERYQDIPTLCLGGGVALNCVVNGKLADLQGRENVYIFPAAGDSGGAVGAALAYLSLDSQSLTRWDIQNSLLGPNLHHSDILEVLQANDVKAHRLSRSEMAKRAALLLSEGQILGVMNGRSEFGPRALGNRSILADPRIMKGQVHINERIKFRESFRPFAPVALEEFAGEWFSPPSREPFMIRVNQVLNTDLPPDPPDSSEAGSSPPIDISHRLEQMHSPLPSVTHLDGSARLQTISASDDRLVKDILDEFRALTGCPVLINTSFNVRGEPIVNSPHDALRCLATTHLDAVIIDDWIVMRDEQSSAFLNQFDSAVADD